MYQLDQMQDKIQERWEFRKIFFEFSLIDFIFYIGWGEGPLESDERPK